MEQFLCGEVWRLQKINVHKVYYLYTMDSINVCITIKDYFNELGNDYCYFIEKLNDINVGCSVLTLQEFIDDDHLNWGWKELEL